MRASVRVTALLVVCLVALPAFAGEGRAPIYQDPTVITSSGKYIVTRDIVGVSGLPIIDIQASHVDIDLNGFVLTGGPGGPAVINAFNQDNITIRNGTVLTGNDGIRLQGQGNRKVVIEDVKVIDTEFLGIVILGMSDVAIRRVNVLGTGDTAIYLDGQGLLPVHGTVEDSQVEACGGGIRVVGGSSFAIVRNRVEDVTIGNVLCPAGIIYDVSTGGLIAENTVQIVAGGAGICLGDTDGCKLYNNVVWGPDNDGIYLAGLSDDNLVIENVVTAAGADGVAVEGSRNFVDRNLLNSNGTFGAGHGLHFYAVAGAQNTYGRNTARGNPGGPCLPPPGPPWNTTDYCDDTFGANDSFGDNYVPGPPVQ